LTPERVYLLGAHAYLEGFNGESVQSGEVSLIGLFDIEEFHPRDPAAYVQSPGYSVVHVDDDHDNPTFYFVDAWVLKEHRNPATHGRELFSERLDAFHQLEQECT
jgi:hypothetical protein